MGLRTSSTGEGYEGTTSMPDAAFYQNDLSGTDPMLEQLARTYVEAYPQYDLPTARMIVDTHPSTQALLGRTVDEAPAPVIPAGDTLQEAPPALKVGEFEWQGEVLDLDPAVGYALLAEYRANAAALHAAKEAAKATEQKIMQTLGGYEHGAVDGQQLFHWPIVNSTSFNAKAFKEDPVRKALYEEFLVTKPTRRFKVDGTVGVD